MHQYTAGIGVSRVASDRAERRIIAGEPPSPETAGAPGTTAGEGRGIPGRPQPVSPGANGAAARHSLKHSCNASRQSGICKPNAAVSFPSAIRELAGRVAAVG